MNKNMKKTLIVTGAILLTPIAILMGIAGFFFPGFIVGLLFYLIECFLSFSSCFSFYLGG